MKASKILTLVAAGVAVVLTLAGCSQATADSPKTTVATGPTRPTTTALLGLSFKADADQFVCGDSWASDNIDISKGVMTINVYGGSHTYTPTATLDLSKATSLFLDAEGDVKVNTSSSGNSSWWFSGFRVVLVDSSGNKFDFADIKDSTDFNAASYTTIERKVSAGSWESSGTGDLSKITSIVIYSNYNQGSLTLKDFDIY